MNRHTTHSLIVAVAALAALTLAAGSAAAATGRTERVSVDSAGHQANGHSLSPTISADGRFIAFASDASNLVDGDTNGARDVFVHDRQSGSTERISVDSAGAQAMRDIFVPEITSDSPSISANGRFVTFYSNASNLVSGDTNWRGDVFVHDRLLGTTERVSVDSTGRQSNDESLNPKISADGRFIAFDSDASNLVSGDTNGARDVFVHDRLSGTTERVSVDEAGGEADGFSAFSAISGDGRFVAFMSDAADLVSGDTNRTRDVFVHDRQSGRTERVSLSDAGAQADGASDYFPSISADGRVVAFASRATNLVAGDTNAGWDIFVRDRGAGSTERMAVGIPENEMPTGDFRLRGDLSADGRFVALSLSALTSPLGGVLVHDRQTEMTEVVSVDSDGGNANGPSMQPAISADGRFIAYTSAASNLVPGHWEFGFFISGDTNSAFDVFVRDRRGDITPPTINVPTSVSVEANNAGGARVAYSVSVSDDVDPNPTWTCNPASGSLFPLGSTSVTCTATDASGNSSTATFVVTVVDTTAPTLAVPPSVSANATSPAGVVITYTASATDTVDPSPTVSCSPAAGTLFVVGDTLVSCTAVDASGNRTLPRTFTVHVKAATEQISDIVATVETLDAKQGVVESLDAKLQNVLDALNSAKAGDRVTACKKLDAFINEVQAQTAKALTQADADRLIADARRIKVVIGCG